MSMARIFISYSKQNPEPTRALAAFLEGEGFSVWWDTNLVGGETFRAEMIKHLDAADVAIVVWTPQSVLSEWVHAEANRADAKGKLLPVRADGVEILSIPMPYTTRHTEPIENRVAIVAAIRRIAGATSSGAEPRPAPLQPSAPKSPSAAAFAEIEAELDPAEYRLFAEHWKGAAEAKAAEARELALRSWAGVDKSDAAAIEGFSTVRPALRRSRAPSPRLWRPPRRRGVGHGRPNAKRAVRPASTRSRKSGDGSIFWPSSAQAPMADFASGCGRAGRGRRWWR